MSDSVVDALRRAVKSAGGQTSLSNKVNAKLAEINEHLPDDAKIKPISQKHIWNWLKRDKKVPAEYGMPIESAVNGEVSCAELCPAVFAYNGFQTSKEARI